MPDVLFEATAILQESKEGMARIHRIVRDLGSFSHVDDDGTTTLDVNVAVESALTMLRNEIKYRARIERDLRSTQSVRANQARLGQVFLNIILNAAQALDETTAKRNVVRVRSFDEIQQAIDGLTPSRILSHLERHPARDFTIVTLGPQALKLSA